MTETTEEFAGRVVGAIDAASVAILLSIGHQTRLFDTLAGSSTTTRHRGPTRCRSSAPRC